MSEYGHISRGPGLNGEIERKSATEEYPSWLIFLF